MSPSPRLTATGAFRAVVNRTQALRAFAGAAMGAVVALLTAGAWVRGAPLITPFELATVNYRIRLFADPRGASKDIGVVVVDDTTESLFKRHGKSWPPTRADIGHLIENLELLQPRAVALDYLFDGNGESGPGRDRFLEPAPGPATSDPADAAELEARRKDWEVTHELASTFWQTGHVGFALRTSPFLPTDSPDDVRKATEADPFLEKFLRARFPRVVLSGSEPPTKHAERGSVPHLDYPAASLIAGARVLGLADLEEMRDADEQVRRFAPFTSVDGFDIPALGLAAVSAATAPRPADEIPDWPDAGPPSPTAWPALADATYVPGAVIVGTHRIPLRDDGTAWIRWRGNWERDPALRDHVVSAADIFNNQDHLMAGDPLPDLERRLRGKVVLVGFTSHGEFTDKVSSPFEYTPGLFAHVSVADTILTGDYLAQPPRWLEIAVILLLSMTVGAVVLGVPQFRWVKRFGNVGVVAWLASLGVIAPVAYFAIAVFAFQYDWILNMVPALSASIVTLILAVSTTLAFARRSEDQALAIANRALSPQLVARYQREHDGMPPLGGEKVEVTVYFSDIAGFTTISEQVAPEEMVKILNEYLTRVTELLENAHHAYISGYIGDAVMAMWGAPVPAEDHALRACLAALDTMKAMEQFSAELVARGLSPLKTRIGINTGPAVAGAIGHPRGKFNYTALGDTVNSGSRLEGANKAYGTRCMLGEVTWAKVKDAIFARELDLLRMKGKHIAVHVYELIGKQSDPFPREREIARRYEGALGKYRARAFAAARVEFEALVKEFDDPPSKTLVRRCDERLATPPPADWDGSNELTEK